MCCDDDGYVSPSNEVINNIFQYIGPETYKLVYKGYAYYSQDNQINYDNGLMDTMFKACTKLCDLFMDGAVSSSMIKC
jgi:hypothetical protein